MSPTAKVRNAGAWQQSGLTGAARVAGAWVPFSPPAPPSGVSLFTTQVPFNVDLADGSDSYSLGTYMQSSVPGNVTHIRWVYPASAQPGGVAPIASLFRQSDGAQVATNVTMPSPGTPSTVGTPNIPAWNQVALITPVHFNAGQVFCPVVWTPLRYVASSGAASPWPLTNGVLSTSADAGRFTGGASGVPEFPTNNFNSGCYFVDVIFVPD